MIMYYSSPNVTYIYRTMIVTFMKYNPPCKDCLVRCMCLKDIMTNSHIDSHHLKDTEIVHPCELLLKFIKNNKYFKDVGVY